MKTSIFVYFFLGIKFSHVYGYRDGARNESCFNHIIDHGARLIIRECTPQSNCRYFLRIKEVVDEGTLELGNETEYYECGKLYGVEVANTLNPPEGFLVQARSGPEDSSEIIGTFLDPSVVAMRDSSIPMNYKILECQLHQSAGPELYPNSATHPFTVNDAGILQLFWRAPNCTEEILPNVTMWFTIVQQLLIAHYPAKFITLTYRPPRLIPTTTSALVSLLPTSTYLQAMPTSIMSALTTDHVQPSQNGTATGQDKLLLIIGLSGGVGGVVFLVIVITVVIGIKWLCGSCKKKKKQSSITSVSWTAANEPPSTPESNRKLVEFVTDSEPLTSKEHKENDSKLVNSGNVEDSSYNIVVA